MTVEIETRRLELQYPGSLVASSRGNYPHQTNYRGVVKNQYGRVVCTTDWCDTAAEARSDANRWIRDNR